MTVKWVQPDGPEHAERLSKCLAEFLARSLRPDVYRLTDDCQSALRRADELLAEDAAAAAKPVGRDDEIQARIAELEAEIATLKGQLGNSD